jgi:tetratricopeptide (TPR) repeat protein
MTIRPISWRRAIALLLIAGCATGGGCQSTSLQVTPPDAAPSGRGDRSSVAAPTPPDPTAPSTVDLSRRSPAEACRACLATAREMEAHGNHAAAIEQYERAREFAPNEPGIAARLAALHERSANHDRAAAEYAIALKEDPANADLWNDLAHFRFQRAEFVDAEFAARRALVLDPNHKRAWVTLGLIEAELERYDDAFASLTHAVSPAAAHNDLGIILARQGKADLARKQFAAARRLDPTLKQPASPQPAASNPLEAKRTIPSSPPSVIKRS